jgi:hypothetical protein
MLVAACAAVLAAVFSATIRAVAGGTPSDLDQVLVAARALWEGRDAYAVVGPGREFDWPWPLYYPMTAAALLLPVAWMPAWLARALFVGASTGCLAYAVTRDGWGRLPLLGSPPFLTAVGAAQWAPLLTAAFFLPPVALAAAAKPTVGLAVVVAASIGSPRTLAWAAAGGMVLGVVSLALRPDWVPVWLASVQQAVAMTAPISHRGGVLLLLALLRWRRAEARLLLTLACVPHNITLYETLYLFAVPSTRRESTALMACSVAALVFIQAFDLGQPHSAAENYYSGDVFVALAYLPALLMVLRRPNCGQVVAPLERVAAWAREIAGGRADAARPV